MAEQVRNLIAKWSAAWPSPLIISRQRDNGQFRINLVDYPEPENYEDQSEEVLETISYYLTVWMKQTEAGEIEKLAPIQLPGPYWRVYSPYTQLVQCIKFQFFATSSVTGYIGHSAIFTGLVLDSLEEDGEDIGVIPAEMWDAYKQYIEDKIIAAGVTTIDPTLSIQGAAADAKAAGDAVAELNERLTELEGGGTGGLTADIKAALLACFAHVAWDSADPTGQSYINALQTALYPPANLSRITAVYTQSGTVWSTDTLDSLKANLVVTAYYSDNTSEVVSNYTLSGTLTAGTRTITASYGGKTATFTVVVTQASKNTSPAIAQSDKRLNNKNVVVDCAGMSLTEYYDITNINKLTIHNYYTEETAPYNVAYTCLVDANDTFLKYYNLATATEQSKDWSAETFANPATKMRFSLFTSGLTTAYAYDTDTGNILFAGSASPYYGMDNISEASA